MIVIQICRIENESKWDIVTNPAQSDLDKARQWLVNDFNQYVETKNCGVVYRYIRARDLKKYDTGE